MNEMNGDPQRYVLRSPLSLYEIDGQLHLIQPVRQHFHLHIRLQQHREQRCFVSIAEISVESFVNHEYHLAVIVNNTGLRRCSLRVLLQSATMTLVHPQIVQLYPMYQQLIYFTLIVQRKKSQCEVLLNDASTNQTFASRDVSIEAEHHCTCLSICQCRVRWPSPFQPIDLFPSSWQCVTKGSILFPEDFDCVPMLSDEIRRAGLTDVYSHRTTSHFQRVDVQSRYVRKWFVFIAILALSLRECVWGVNEHQTRHV